MEEVKSKIVVGGETTKKGIKSSAYQQIKADNATHIKAVTKTVVDKETGKPKSIVTNEFIEIKDTMRFIRVRINSETGSPVGKGELIHYTEIKPDKNYKYQCVDGEILYMIESLMFSKVSFMRNDPSPKSTHYKCADGVYVRKDEVQVPAYKIVDMPIGHNLIQDTIHNNKHYVEMAKIEVDGKVMEVASDFVKSQGDKHYWYHKDKHGKEVRQECDRIGVEKKYVNYVMVDGKTVVKLDKLTADSNGEYVVDLGEKGKVSVAKTEIDVKGLFVEGAAVGATREIKANPTNKDVATDINNATFVFDKKKGITRIIANKNDGYAVVVTGLGKDSHYEIILKHNTIRLEDVLARLEAWSKSNKDYQFNRHTKDSFNVRRVEKFEIIDAAEEGIKIVYPEMGEKALAEDVKVKDGQVIACTLSGKQLTDIKWSDDLDFPRIEEYTIDGVTISNIEWTGEKIGSCVVSFKDENGESRIVNLKGTELEKSAYNAYAIRNSKNVQVRDLKIDSTETEQTTLSFKIGDYTITKAEYDITNKNIGKCVVQHKNGPEQVIDLSVDPRFKHLQMAIQVSLDADRVKPLLESRLVEKKDGKYEKVADVVQTGPIESNGTASAEKLDSLEQAVKAQEEFTEKPYPTWTIDSKGKIHQVDDVKNSYSGESEFECEVDYFKNLIGKDKIEVKKGKIVIDPKAGNERRNNQLFVGLALCSNFLTMPIGLCILGAGIVTAIAEPIRRAIKERRLNNLTVEKVMAKTREKVKAQCQKNIKKLEKEFRRKVAWGKKNMSSEAFREYQERASAEFMTKMSAEATKMSIYGEGALACNFDLGKKTKLTSENMLGWIAGNNKKRELVEGKKPSSKFKSAWKTRVISAETGKHTEKITAENVQEAVAVLESLGGRKEHIKAYKLRMKHADVFRMSDKNFTDANRPDLEAYKMEMRADYYRSVAEDGWASIDDKVDAFKRSEEFTQYTTAKERKEAIEGKRSELTKKANSTKVTGAEFGEVEDKNGNLMSDVYGQKIMNKAAQTVSKVLNTELNAEEEVYGTTLAEQVCHVAGGSNVRRLRHDAMIAQSEFEQVKDQQQNIDNEIMSIKDRSAIAIKQGNYELAYMLQTEIKSKEQQYKDELARSKKNIEGRLYGELTSGQGGDLSKRLDKLMVVSRTIDKRLQTAKEVAQREHERRVKLWASEEFVSKHSKEFNDYVDDLRKKAPNLNFDNENVVRGVVASFTSNMLSKEINANDDQREIYQEQMDMLMVKHNIEENVAAQAYCEDADVKAKYEEYCAKNPSLKPEEARLWFYAKRKREDAVAVDKFKKANKDKLEECAVKRLEEGKLKEHQKKDRKLKLIKGKSKETNATAKVSATAAPVAAPAHEIGHTA